MVETATPERRAKIGRSGEVKPWASAGVIAFALSAPAHGPNAAEL